MSTHEELRRIREVLRQARRDLFVLRRPDDDLELAKAARYITTAEHTLQQATHRYYEKGD